MSLDADTLVERRRLRRRVSFWRVVAFVVAAAAILAIAAIGTRDRFGEQIARVPISGVITDDWKQREFLRKLGENDRIKAVILAINSPGGTTTGGEALFTAIRELAEKKPVVATIGTVGASAGYLVAIGADHVLARETSITGSIGVIFQWANLRELGEKIGVDVRSIKSDPLKAEPSPFAEETPEARRVIQNLIDDTQDWFVTRVAERRELSAAAARGLADGRVYSGRRALQLNIIDGFGGEEEAKAWLVAEHGISEAAEIRTWTQEGGIEELGFAGRLMDALGGGDTLTTVLTRIGELVPGNGLVSLWSPQAIED